MITRLLKPLIEFYKTGPDKPLAYTDPEEIRRRYERMRWSVFLSVVIGYSFFYVGRLVLSVVKQPLIDNRILNAQQLGYMESALLFTYAIGKLVNGFLADNSNIKRFMPTGLFLSALVNVILGIILGTKFASVIFLIILWGLNGWFQSTGSAPSVVAISHWFSVRERGTMYGIWSIAHSVGEGLTFVVTALVVGALGWRYGFLSAGISCMIMAVLMYIFLADRPQTYGLPHVEEYKRKYAKKREVDEPSQNEGKENKSETSSDKSSGGKKRSIWEQQLEVVKNPAIWVLGLSSALMYVARYAVNNWGILYLQKAKSFSIEEAGAILGIYSIFNTIGSGASGWISDTFFGSRRNVPILLYGILMNIGLAIFYFFPPKSELWAFISMAFFGFGLGGMLVFLGGLLAVDISPRNAAGAAMGFIGLFSYLGAAIQGWVSGSLLEAHKIATTNGAINYNFTPVFTFWMSAGILSLLLALTLWNVKPRED